MHANSKKRLFKYSVKKGASFINTWNTISVSLCSRYMCGLSFFPLKDKTDLELYAKTDFLRCLFCTSLLKVEILKFHPLSLESSLGLMNCLHRKWQRSHANSFAANVKLKRSKLIQKDIPGSQGVLMWMDKLNNFDTERKWVISLIYCLQFNVISLLSSITASVFKMSSSYCSSHMVDNAEVNTNEKWTSRNNSISELLESSTWYYTDYYFSSLPLTSSEVCAPFLCKQFPALNYMFVLVPFKCTWELLSFPRSNSYVLLSLLVWRVSCLSGRKLSEQKHPRYTMDYKRYWMEMGYYMWCRKRIL